MKKKRQILMLLPVLILLPFLIEMIVSFYDTVNNPWTQPYSIVIDGGVVQEGVNKREFKEVRFRARGLKFYFISENISSVEADKIAEEVTGSVKYIQNEKQIGFYKFKLVPQLRKDFDSVDFKSSEIESSLTLAERALVECLIEPVSAEDIDTANRLAAYEFELGEVMNLEFEFEGDLPPSSKLRFSYSKSPDSVFHGTFLQGIMKATVYN